MYSYTQEIHMVTKIYFKWVVKAQIFTTLNCAMYMADTENLLNDASKATPRHFLNWPLFTRALICFVFVQKLILKRKAVYYEDNNNTMYVYYEDKNYLL